MVSSSTSPLAKEALRQRGVYVCRAGKPQRLDKKTVQILLNLSGSHTLTDFITGLGEARELLDDLWIEYHTTTDKDEKTAIDRKAKYIAEIADKYRTLAQQGRALAEAA